MRPLRNALIVIALAVIATLTSPIANAATEPTPTDFTSMTPKEVYAAKTAVTHDEMMAKMGASGPPVSGLTASTTGSGCYFASDGDYVHRSTYSGVLYASGHGYWWNVNCPASYRANVTIWLEEKLGTSWYPQGNSVTGYNRAPGSGSTQRVNAKMKCVNTTTHKWRSIVVADIVGHADTSPAAYTAARSLACY